MIPTWFLVAKPFLKRAAPFLAAFLVLLVAYQCGAGRARAKAERKLAVAEAEAGREIAERKQCEAILRGVRDELKASAERIAEEHARFIQRVNELEAVTSAERQRLSEVYARSLEEARAESEDLRNRIVELEPGEACLEVVKEVANAIR